MWRPIASSSIKVSQSVSAIKIGIPLGENYACAAVLTIVGMMGVGWWVYIFGHRPTGDVPGIPDGQSAPADILNADPEPRNQGRHYAGLFRVKAPDFM